MEKFKNEKFWFCNTLRIFVFLLLQNKQKLPTEMYKCTKSPGKNFMLDFFRIDIFKIYIQFIPFLSENIAVQRQSLQCVLPDILCKSKKE